MPNYGVGSVLTPKTGPITKEYDAGYDKTFKAAPSKFCPRCEMRPAWCECQKPAWKKGFTRSTVVKP